MTATTYPTSVDMFTDPTPSTLETYHAEMHSEENDAIVAIETLLGLTGSTDSSSVMFKIVRALQSGSNLSDLQSIATARQNLNMYPWQTIKPSGDTTGATDSANWNAALTALGATISSATGPAIATGGVGIVGQTYGTFYFDSSTADIDGGPAGTGNIGHVGAGRGLTVNKPVATVAGTSTAQAEVFAYTNSGFSTFVPASSAPIMGFTVDGSLAGSYVTGFRCGDRGAQMIDIDVENFNHAGSIGADFLNRFGWMERANVHVLYNSCATAIRMGGFGDGVTTYNGVVCAGRPSFDYGANGWVFNGSVPSGGTAINFGDYTGTGLANPATITGVSGTGTPSVVTFTATNTYVVGQLVQLGTIGGAYSSLSNSTVTVVSASGSQFTITSTLTGTALTGQNISALSGEQGFAMWGGHLDANVNCSMGNALTGTVTAVTTSTNPVFTYTGTALYSGMTIALAGAGLVAAGVPAANYVLNVVTPTTFTVLAVGGGAPPTTTTTGTGTWTSTWNGGTAIVFGRNCVFKGADLQIQMENGPAAGHTGTHQSMRFVQFSGKCLIVPKAGSKLKFVGTSGTWQPSNCNMASSPQPIYMMGDVDVSGDSYFGTWTLGEAMHVKGALTMTSSPGNVVSGVCNLFLNRSRLFTVQLNSGSNVLNIQAGAVPNRGGEWIVHLINPSGTATLGTPTGGGFWVNGQTPTLNPGAGATTILRIYTNDGVNFWIEQAGGTVAAVNRTGSATLPNGEHTIVTGNTAGQAFFLQATGSTVDGTVNTITNDNTTATISLAVSGGSLNWYGTVGAISVFPVGGTMTLVSIGAVWYVISTNMGNPAGLLKGSTTSATTGLAVAATAGTDYVAPGGVGSVTRGAWKVFPTVAIGLAGVNGAVSTVVPDSPAVGIDITTIVSVWGGTTGTHQSTGLSLTNGNATFTDAAAGPADVGKTLSGGAGTGWGTGITVLSVVGSTVTASANYPGTTSGSTNTTYTETCTVQYTATYDNGSTSSFTSTAFQPSSAANTIGLVSLVLDGHYVTSVAIQAKTNAASTTLTYVPVLTGRNIN